MLCIIWLFSIFSSLGALEPAQVEQLLAQGITVDLREPQYCEGVLTTEKGGVISAPDLRIQARSIVYTRKVIEGEPVCTLVAEGDLIIEFGNYLFVGRCLEFDFQTRHGTIYEGRTAVEPWFFGGQRIELCADGQYIIHNGFITTSENLDPDWQIHTEEAIIDQNMDLSARKISFLYEKIRLFCWPTFKTNLATLGESPLSYTVRWGGRQGPRVGLTYEAISWQRFKTFLRLDYRLNRGLGFGIETQYTSPDHCQSLETISYIAQDSSLVHPDEKSRYRLQGVYNYCNIGQGFNLDLTWDKLSDKYMATDYYDKGLELDTAERTQLHMRRERPNNISNFFIRLKANSFQTVKEELPSLQTCWRPMNLGSTGLISDSSAKSAYLDFRYANFLEHVHDYDSTRFELIQKIYRPLHFKRLHLLPQIGGAAIYYGNTPLHRPRWVAVGIFKIDINTRLQCLYDDAKHVLVPYVNYSYITFPTTDPHDHFIFDIEDGWYRLNMVRFGLQQFFYVKDNCDYVERAWSADLWANAFFNTKTLHSAIPKIYAQLTLKSTPSLRHILQTAWNSRYSTIDHFNFRTEWTLSADLALAAEYRHRDSRDWRKVDRDNFILDSFRSVQRLLHSSLSDRRDTLLLHLFYRLHPNFAVEFESRQGWNRIHERSYTEFEIDFLTTLRSAWNLKLSYRHQEDDDRVAVSLSIGLPRLNFDTDRIPCLEF
jgi:hypothetical protein